MKVKISYTVNIDDIPRELDSLLQKILHIDFVNDLYHIQQLVKNEEMPEANLAIDRLRQKMLDADLIFDDCAKIIDGYLAASNPLPQQLQNNLPVLKEEEKEEK